jgi:hypothetical protein
MNKRVYIVYYRFKGTKRWIRDECMTHLKDARALVRSSSDCFEYRIGRYDLDEEVK